MTIVRSTLPAHRFEGRKKQNAPRVWTYDFDATITAAPKQLARIAQGLKAQGDTIIVLTGNAAPHDELVAALKDYDFPFDEVVQYHDDDTNGVDRAEYLKRFGTWGAFDNRIDRAPIFAKVCPHLYVIADLDAEAADTAKKDAKQTAKALGLRGNFPPERRGPPHPPPNLRVSDSTEDESPEHECGTCVMWDRGLCWGYGNFPTDGEWVCDSWSPDPNWQQQDAAEDAANDKES